MSRRSQRFGASSFVARRLFHHPGGVALPGQTVSLSPDAAERALRMGDVRPAAARSRTPDQPSTEETP